jgi:hypothetical protein
LLGDEEEAILKRNLFPGRPKRDLKEASDSRRRLGERSPTGKRVRKKD